MFAKTAVKRTGRERFVRNVLIAIGNSGDPALAPHAERLLADPSPLIRGAAVWALGRLDPARLASLAPSHAGEQRRLRRRGMGRRGRSVLGLPQQRSSSGGSTMAALTRRTMLAGLSAAAVLRPDRAFAAWPERSISLIHGLTAGGGVDVSARLIADGLSRKLGQQVVVEPKPGAGGTLASSQIARATPDGYTLCWIPSGYAVTAAMYKSLPYQPIDDFTIIGQAIDFPFVMVTYPDHPIRNIPDLIKVAKERKEPLLGGVPGAGTPQHMLLEYLSHLAGIKIQVVTFRGGNQALTELLGKRLDFLVDPPIALIGQIKSGGAACDRHHRREALRAAARRRHHRRSGLPRIFRHLVDGTGRPRQAAAAGHGQAQRRHQRADRRPRRGGENPLARQRAEGRHARRLQGADRQGHRALDQGDRRRRHIERI